AMKADRLVRERDRIADRASFTDERDEGSEVALGAQAFGGGSRRALGPPLLPLALPRAPALGIAIAHGLAVGAARIAPTRAPASHATWAEAVALGATPGL